jgi:hypothetical protein
LQSKKDDYKNINYVKKQCQILAVQLFGFNLIHNFEAKDEKTIFDLAVGIPTQDVKI